MVEQRGSRADTIHFQNKSHRHRSGHTHTHTHTKTSTHRHTHTHTHNTSYSYIFTRRRPDISLEKVKHTEMPVHIKTNTQIHTHTHTQVPVFQSFHSLLWYYFSVPQQRGLVHRKLVCSSLLRCEHMMSSQNTALRHVVLTGY